MGWGVRTGSVHCRGRALLARGTGCLGDRRVLRHLRRGTRPLEAPWPAPTPGPLSRSGKPLRSFFSSYLKSLPDVRKKLLSLPEKPNKDENPEVVVWREFDRQVPSGLSCPGRGCMHGRPCSPERWASLRHAPAGCGGGVAVVLGVVAGVPQGRAQGESTFRRRRGSAGPAVFALRSKLYTADLESGLHHLLRGELAAHKALAGAELRTLKDFVTVLARVRRVSPGPQGVLRRAPGGVAGITAGLSWRTALSPAARACAGFVPAQHAPVLSPGHVAEARSLLAG